MTGWDGVFLTLALADLLIVAFLAWIGLQLAQQGKTAAALANPAVARLRGTAAHAMRLADKARRTSQDIISEVKTLAQRVQARVETTRHLIRELRPPVDGQEARAVVRGARRTAARGKEWADRFGRLRRAARGARSRGDD